MRKSVTLATSEAKLTFAANIDIIRQCSTHACVPEPILHMFQSQIWLIFTSEPRFELQLASVSRCLDTGRPLVIWQLVAL